MNTHSSLSHILSHVIVIGTALLLSACGSLPENLKTDNTNVVTDYSQWRASRSTNNEVRLGGVIASVSNLEQTTRVEIVNLPIGSTGKPDIDKEPQGRFIAYIKGFVDPVMLSQGRLITLLGRSDEMEMGQVGDFNYEFPVMNVTGYHLWRIEEKVILHDIDNHFYSCRSLYCRDLRFGTRQGKVIQEVK